MDYCDCFHLHSLCTFITNGRYTELMSDITTFEILQAKHNIKKSMLVD